MLIFLLLWVAGGDLPVLRHHLGGAATHVVVGTGYGEAGTHLAEQHGAVCHAGAACSGLPRQSCLQRRRDGAVVIPSVEPGAVHHVANQLAAVVVGEYIIAGSALPCERAGSRAAQRVVLVGAPW